MPVEVYYHAANVMFLLSYLVREIFVLRFLVIIGGLLFFPYFILIDGGPLMTPIIWGTILSLVNIYQLFALFRERRPVVLSAEDHKIYRMGFSEFTIKQFAKLLKIGKRQQPNEGETILSKDVVPDRVVLVLNGNVIKEDQPEKELEDKHLGAGQLVGELCYVMATPLNHQVQAGQNLEILCWENNDLQKLLSSDPELKSSWQGMITSRLAQRLSAA